MIERPVEAKVKEAGGRMTWQELFRTSGFRRSKVRSSYQNTTNGPRNTLGPSTVTLWSKPEGAPKGEIDSGEESGAEAVFRRLRTPCF